jgi:hypothetical protein
MADKKISALSSATTPLAGTEVLPIVQSGATVKVATDDLTVRNIRANATTGILQVTGPAAGSTRVVTVPNANFTAARTDAAQTFTGAQTFDTYAQVSYLANTALLRNVQAATSGIGGTNGGTTTTYVQFDNAQEYPVLDNTLSLGLGSFRWTTVYATTPLINTSDINTKQDISELDEAEKRVATRIKSLIKKYRFKDAVIKKGDAARIHVGAIAQEVQSAFVAEGLDANRYGVFCSDTWYEVDGKPSPIALEPFTENTPNAVPKTRLGLRYEELFAFVISVL